MPEPDTVVVETPRGAARTFVTRAEGDGAGRWLVLGHGAGGGVGAADLQAARDAALALGWTVALVEQPYRVAGRRSPAPAGHLDEAWLTVVERLRLGAAAGAIVVTGGRSSGARVACRTAAAVGAAGVLCLAFPLRPPARAGATRRPADRLAELDAVPVPVLVVQGDRDRFGIPPPGAGRTVVTLRGDHALRSDSAAVAGAVTDWLGALRTALP